MVIEAPVKSPLARLRPRTVIAGEMIIHHERCVDSLGRWFGLVKLGIETEFRYPSLEMWVEALKDVDILAHDYNERPGAFGFSGRLWIYYKEHT